MHACKPNESNRTSVCSKRFGTSSTGFGGYTAMVDTGFRALAGGAIGLGNLFENEFDADADADESKAVFKPTLMEWSGSSSMDKHHEFLEKVDANIKEDQDSLARKQKAPALITKNLAELGIENSELSITMAQNQKAIEEEQKQLSDVNKEALKKQWSIRINELKKKRSKDIIANKWKPFKAMTQKRVRAETKLETNTQWKKLVQGLIPAKARMLVHGGWLESPHCPVDTIRFSRTHTDDYVEGTEDHKNSLKEAVGFDQATASDAPTAISHQERTTLQLTTEDAQKKILEAIFAQPGGKRLFEDMMAKAKGTTAAADEEGDGANKEGDGANKDNDKEGDDDGRSAKKQRVE